MNPILIGLTYTILILIASFSINTEHSKIKKDIQAGTVIDKKIIDNAQFKSINSRYVEL